MKNNKGFILTETLIVSAVVLTTLVLIYTQFSKINKNYGESYLYDTVNGMYSLKAFGNYLEEEGNLDNIYDSLVTYIDISDCESNYYVNKSYCSKMMDMYNIKYLFFTYNNKSYMYGSLVTENPYDLRLQYYVKTLNDSNENYSYRLVAEFNDGTYSSVPFVLGDRMELVTTFYENGTPIYFNPNTARLCEESEVVSTTGTRSGCMKWYTFNDSEGATEISMILDHNTTSTCTYGGSLVHLKGDTAKWDKRLTPRIITADEVAQIVGHPTWNSDTATTDNKFYLDSLDKTQTKNASNPSSYAWLFNNLYQSKTYGGTEEDNNSYNYSYYNSRSNGSTAIATTYTYGYWTITDISTYSTGVWLIDTGGYLNYGIVNRAYYYGVRPVITLSKALIEK